MRNFKIFLLIISFLFTGATLTSASSLDGSITVTVNPIPPPTNLTSSCNSGGTLASLSWTLPSGYTLSYLRVMDNYPPGTGGYAALIPEWSADNGPSFSFASTPGHNYTSWVHTRLPSGASSSEIYSSFNCIPAPTGTLTGSPSSCTITAGNSSCNVTLMWTATDLNGTLAITSNYPSANTTLAVLNIFSNFSIIAVPFLSSPRILYLYSNATLLAQTTATSSCAINTTWNGSVCALNTYTVSTSAGAGGSITPASRTGVSHGSTTTFTVAPNSGYSIGSVLGCGGSLSGNTYTTGPIIAACTVTATFSPILLVPTVTTRNIFYYTQTTASGGGNVTSNGGDTVTVGGIVWSTSANPTTALATKTVHSGWADYSTWGDNMTGLTANTLYHVRAYATNSVGTAYGADISFTTLHADCTGTPWGTMTSGTSNTAYLSSTVSYPATCTSQTRTCTDGTLSGTYTFTTCNQALVLPTVTTTSPVTSITQTTATGGGNITSNGGSIVTTSGCAWSTSINPVYDSAQGPISGNIGQVTNGPLAGSYSCSLSGLTANTTYHVRAYAKNSVGTSYGPNDVSFTTSLLLLPTVTTTTPVTSITQTTATGGGNITSNGGSIVTTSGCAWSTSINPVYDSAQGPISGNIGQVTNGPLAGSYSCSLSGLTTGTTYHVRAYATNVAGTKYGDDVSFTTIGVTLGSLTASGCIIKAGERTCPVTLNWSTTNPVVTSTIRTPLSISTPPIYTANSGVDQVYTYTVSSAPSTATFYLVNNGFNTFANSTVSCVPDYHWGGSSCVKNIPTNTFIATPSTIFKGKSSTLTWDSPLSDYCTGTGFITGVAGSSATIAGSVVINPLVTTTYKLSCTTTGTSENTVIVKVINLNVVEN